MANYIFLQPAREDILPILPQLFRILHTNMNKIAPTGCRYEEDESVWLSFMNTRSRDAFPQFILMYDEDTLIGYFQFSFSGHTLIAEEIEISPSHQRTFLFYRFLQYFRTQLDDSVSFVEAYVNKSNRNCLQICEKLGFLPVGETTSGNSTQLLGTADAIISFLARERQKPPLCKGRWHGSSRDGGIVR